MVEPHVRNRTVKKSDLEREVEDNWDVVSDVSENQQTIWMYYYGTDLLGDIHLELGDISRQIQGLKGISTRKYTTSTVKTAFIQITMLTENFTDRSFLLTALCS